MKGIKIIIGYSPEEVEGKTNKWFAEHPEYNIKSFESQIDGYKHVITFLYSDFRENITASRNTRKAILDAAKTLNSYTDK